jgi:hypothetical protein
MCTPLPSRMSVCCDEQGTFALRLVRPLQLPCELVSVCRMVAAYANALTNGCDVGCIMQIVAELLAVVQRPGIDDEYAV